MSYIDMMQLQSYFLFSIHEDLTKETEQQYKQNEAFYKNRMKALDEKLNNCFVRGLPIDLKWQLLKTIAVLERPTAEEEKEALISYARMGFKRIYDYASLEQPVDTVRAINFLFDRYGEMPDSILQCMTALYVFLMPEKRLSSWTPKPSEQALFHNFELLAQPPIVKKKELELTDEQKKEALNLFTKLTGKKWRGTESKYLDTLFSSIEYATIMANPAIQKEVMRTKNHTIAYKLEPLKYLRFGNSIIQLLGYDNVLIYTNLIITKEEWFDLYGIVLNNQTTKDFEPSDMPMMMCYTLLFFAQHKLYQGLSEQYESHMYSVSMSEIEEAKEKLHQEKAEITQEAERKIDSYLQEIHSLKEELARLEQEKARLEKQSAQYKNEADKNADKAILNERLLQSIFNEASQDVEQVESIPFPSKVVYIGGHPQLQRQLKEQFADWYFIDVDETNRGEQQVKNADLVIFNSHRNNHVQFERLKSFLTMDRAIFAKYGSNIQTHIADIQSQYRLMQKKLKE